MNSGSWKGPVEWRGIPKQGGKRALGLATGMGRGADEAIRVCTFPEKEGLLWGVRGSGHPLCGEVCGGTGTGRC